MSQFESIDPTRLRWFAEVAEQLHFTRAARSLGISRQRLSATVIDLEAELGEKLFVPGAESTQLTDTGTRLLHAAHEILARPVESEPCAQEAAGLRVGFVPGVTVSKWERIWRERFPETPLETIALAAADQQAALAEGRVDMCFVRLPIDREGLGVIPLYRELPVVVVPKEHEISLFDQVSATDLTEERLQDASDLDQAAVVFEMVAAGVGPAVVPHSIARLHARRDLVYRTVTDHPDTEIALAWPLAAAGELVEEFIGVVRGRTARSTRSPSAAKGTPNTDGAQGKTAQGKSAQGKGAHGRTAQRKSSQPKSAKRGGAAGTPGGQAKNASARAGSRSGGKNVKRRGR
ncbi:LysR substrate-binding domain-containing protein [Nocardia higoensis]|uniref:LysR substrate-binding domain-containing protein n=1 Tax=Nocardia higoensis TaxID=228599 RepID=UPI0002F3F3AB|nr:LysR substrate-binding domain-containing protein [Nocardia higoensis]